MPPLIFTHGFRHTMLMNEGKALQYLEHNIPHSRFGKQPSSETVAKISKLYKT